MRKVSAKKFKLVGLAIFVLVAFLIVGLWGRGGFFNKSVPARSPDPPQKEVSKPIPDQNKNNNSIDLVRPPFLDE
jgi:hypothetical protein